MNLVRTASPWPFRPRPEPDEGLLGYLLRIAREYRWNTLTSLCGDLLGRQTPVLPHSDNAVRDLSRVLARIMRLDEQQLTDLWLSQRREHRCFDSQRIISDVELRTPRLCPKCICEKGYLPFEWQVGHILECAAHGQALLELCPACSTPFTWRSQLLDSCPTCGYEWRVAKRDADSCRTRHCLPEAQELDRLYRAFLACALPGALDTWRRKVLPYSPGNHGALMARAYGVVCDENRNAELILEGQAKLVGLGVLQKPACHHLRARISSLHVKQPDRTLPAGKEHEVAEQVALPDKVVAACPIGQHPSLMVTAGTCADLLGVSKVTLHDLTDRGVLSEALPHRVQQDRLFHLGTLATRLEDSIAQRADGSVEEPIDFEEATRIVRAFGQKPWRIIAWCQAGALPFTYRRNSALAQGIRVSRAVLLALADEALATDDREVLPRGAVLRLLNVPESALDTLSARGYLPCKRWTSPGAFFECDTVMAFLRRHRVAAREAFIQQRPVTEVWEEIIASGATPVIERMVGARFVGVAVVGAEEPSARGTPR